MNYLRSPIPYMGNKYKLLKNILPLFPRECDIFVDGFGGSGVVSLNYQGTEKTIYNEYNSHIVNLIKTLLKYTSEELDNYFHELIKKYDLPVMSCTTEERQKRTEYKIRSDKYNKLRDYYNNSLEKDYRVLYLLCRYSINNLIRFNSEGKFNAPSGSGAYNDSILKDIKSFQEEFKKVTISNADFFSLDLSTLTPNSFVYCDCPYSNTMAVYNEKRANGGWSIGDDKKLFQSLENLSKRQIRRGLSNVFENRGKVNQHLIDWCNENGWYVYHFDRNYNPFRGGEKSNNDEVYITNYKSTEGKIELW